MTASTLTGETFKLTEGNSTTAIAASVTYNAQSKTATLNPGADLKANTQYTATVTTGAKDKAGNALAQAESWASPRRLPRSRGRRSASTRAGLPRLWAA